ncbi:unnamed protein product [Merluccius merluccius]
MTSETHMLSRAVDRSRHHYSETDAADQQKENHNPRFNGYRPAPSESSDDDFDQYLVEMATPKGKATLQTPCTAKKNSSHVLVMSSDSDGSFEKCE